MQFLKCSHGIKAMLGNDPRIRQAMILLPIASIIMSSSSSFSHPYFSLFFFIGIIVFLNKNQTFLYPSTIFSHPSSIQALRSCYFFHIVFFIEIFLQAACCMLLDWIMTDLILLGHRFLQATNEQDAIVMDPTVDGHRQSETALGGH